MTLGTLSCSTLSLQKDDALREDGAVQLCIPVLGSLLAQTAGRRQSRHPKTTLYKGEES